MKGVEEALDLLMPAFVPIGTERLALADALGRYLAEDVAARFDLPPFDHSTMDGYAVRARDTEGATPSAPKVLPLSGESRTGGPVAPALAPGCAVRIFTGATLPPGADAVVIQENVKADGALVGVLEAVAPGAWVRARGADLVSGAAAIGRGTRIGAGEIGMLAAQRLSAVTVYRRPRVAVVCTGDELRDVHDADAPGTIVNSNAYALAALVREAGCDPVVLPNVPDDLAATVNALRAALTADVVLTCGGVSVGDYDFVKAAFAAGGSRRGSGRCASSRASRWCSGGAAPRRSSGSPAIRSARW